MSNSSQCYGLQHVRLLCTPLFSWSLLKFLCIELVMLSNRLILCCPLLLLPSVFPNIRVFSSESALWKYWSLSFSISPSNEYSGLIFFKIDWFDLFAVWRTLKSLLQHDSSVASVVWHNPILSQGILLYCRNTDQWNKIESHVPMYTLSLTKEKKICNREKIIFSTSGAGKTGQLHVKEWN